MHVHEKILLLKGTRKKRPCLTGHPVQTQNRLEAKGRRKKKNCPWGEGMPFCLF